MQKSTMGRHNVIVVKGAGSGARCRGLDTGSVHDLVSLRYSSVKWDDCSTYFIGLFW